MAGRRSAGGDGFVRADLRSAHQVMERSQSKWPSKCPALNVLETKLLQILSNLLSCCRKSKIDDCARGEDVDHSLTRLAVFAKLLCADGGRRRIGDVKPDSTDEIKCCGKSVSKRMFMRVVLRW